MKTTALVPTLFTVLFFLVACQKELSFGKEGTARYSFDGGTSSCTGASVSGTYTMGTPATAENKVILSVTVDSVGPYAISSLLDDTLNNSSGRL